MTTLYKELSGWLSRKELDELSEARHRPNFCLQLLTEIVARASIECKVDSGVLSNMDNNVQSLEEMLGIVSHG